MAACSGRGQVVPGTGGLCLCDAGFNAGSDMFDSRRIPAYPPELQSDCVVPDAGVIVMWTLLLALNVLRYRDLGKAARRRLYEYNTRNFLRQRPVQLLLFDMLIATPLIMISCCLKLSDRHNVVLGTDVAFTVIFLAGVFLVAAEWGVFQSMQFETLIRSQYLTATAQSTRMVRMHNRLQAGLAGSYLVVTVVPTLIALGMDHSQPPTDNGEVVLLIVRNVGVVLWQFCALAGYVFMLRQVTAIQSSVHSSDKAAMPATPVGRSAQGVLVFLRSNVRSNVVKNSIALFVYTLASIPPAWPYQAYTIPFIVMLLVHSMNPARILNAANQAANGPSSPQSKSPLAVRQGGIGGSAFGSSNNFNVQSTASEQPSSMVVQTRGGVDM